MVMKGRGMIGAGTQAKWHANVQSILFVTEV